MTTCAWRAARPAEGHRVFLLADSAHPFSKEKPRMATKAQEVHEKTEQLIAGGMEKADAFRQLAEEYGQPVGSIRGFYYQHARTLAGGSSRTKRRETSPDDALADARAVLQRAIESIDREVDAAGERAGEANAEYEALKTSAPQRKKDIEARLKALE
jgi:outer membrane murein-binding lipoprotein Lpp